MDLHASMQNPIIRRLTGTDLLSGKILNDGEIRGVYQRNLRRDNLINSNIKRFSCNESKSRGNSEVAVLRSVRAGI